MVSHMVFLTKLGLENLKNLVTSSPWETKRFRGLDDDFGLKRPNHHLGPEYVHLFRAKKYGIWGEFSDKFQVLCKNPDEVTRFDGIAQNLCLVRRSWDRRRVCGFWCGVRGRRGRSFHGSSPRAPGIRSRSQACRSTEQTFSPCALHTDKKRKSKFTHM